MRKGLDGTTLAKHSNIKSYFSSCHPPIDPTNIPNIEKESPLALPVIRFFPVLRIPLYLSIPLSLYRIHHLVRLYTSLPLSLHVHLLCTSRDRSATREKANPAADSRPIPSPSRANTRCSWESRGPSSRISRHSPNSAH